METIFEPRYLVWAVILIPVIVLGVYAVMAYREALK